MNYPYRPDLGELPDNESNEVTVNLIVTDWVTKQIPEQDVDIFLAHNPEWELTKER